MAMAILPQYPELRGTDFLFLKADTNLLQDGSSNLTSEVAYNLSLPNVLPGATPVAEAV